MTPHEKLMLRRHLERAAKQYDLSAQDLQREGHVVAAHMFDAHARDARYMIEKYCA